LDRRLDRGGAPALAGRAAALNVAFIHPDLGLGGAERLVVDAAAHLVHAGHRVVVLTSHHDPARAFPETSDGTLDVRVRGRFLPGHVGQRLRAPCAVARMAWLAALTARLPELPDVVFCDLVPHVIPLLRLVGRARIVLYCHYPDRLLAPSGGALYRWYRSPIDRLEELGTGMADRVLVNSRFTAQRLRESFPRLRVEPIVLYPGVDPLPTPDLAPDGGTSDKTILCMGRFDPRKHVGLAIEALAALRTRLPPCDFAQVRLVVAGGYDPRLREQRETVRELETLVRRLDLVDRVLLRPSPTEAERLALLSECRCVVYTPHDEHFGYVPVEAMAAGRPVVAVSAGGPVETVCDGETGLLCPPQPEAFATALARLLGDGALAARLGSAGRAHVAAHFSRAAFGRRLEGVLRSLVEERRSSR
jgi:alpha-1,3/alpha-1,6-mannosyltransferase